jgi:F420-non-reducing hydrogenase small subunit
MPKPKLALYWAASCGGCEIAVLEINEKILEVANNFEIVFWPVAIDTKYDDVEKMEDGSIAVCLFNGGIRNEEGERIARLLRRKSQVMVAYGSCACEGCIPALINLNSREAMFERAYLEAQSVDNPQKIVPLTKSEVPEGEIELPKMYQQVYRLKDIVPVEYFIPGCPPVADMTWAAINAIITGQLPPAGSVVAGDKTVCETCPKKRDVKKITKIVRPHEVIPDLEICLLEQGIICMGPATRSGCGALCPTVHMPCRGCYGPPIDVLDQGLKMISALGSVIETNDPEEMEKIVEQIEDPAGTFYRFGMAGSLLRRAKHE